jgi:fumarylacetoacetase
MSAADPTNDPTRESWLDSANLAHADFPIQNLPFGRFRPRATNDPFRCGVAIGDQVLDLRLLAGASAWPREVAAWLAPLAGGDLLSFMTLGPAARSGLRAWLSEGLQRGNSRQHALAPCLRPQTEVELSLPCAIGDYTDFYSGIHHATRVGQLMRPDNPLLPNYRWVPIGYHGRSSSVVVSGTSVRRPVGQQLTQGASTPSFGPSQRLDYELELGAFISQGNALGEPIPIARAQQHVFGVCLLNDWSARDLQAWEYQPLGPFLAKSFATSISPWVVTLDALEPFRVPLQRAAGDPAPLPYLDAEDERERGAFALTLEVWLLTAAARAAGRAPARLSRGVFSDAAYWTIAQLVTHHSSNGCNLRPGDLLGTGTLSGPAQEESGSLLELSAGGKNPVRVDGEERRFLEDGDTVILRGYAERPGARRIGLGECSGTISAAS